MCAACVILEDLAVKGDLAARRPRASDWRTDGRPWAFRGSAGSSRGERVSACEGDMHVMVPVKMSE